MPKNDNVVTLRLDKPSKEFMGLVCGDLSFGESIKLIVKYLQQFDPSYTRRIIGEIKGRLDSQNLSNTR